MDTLEELSLKVYLTAGTALCLTWRSLETGASLSKPCTINLTSYPWTCPNPYIDLWPSPITFKDTYSPTKFTCRKALNTPSRPTYMPPQESMYIPFTPLSIPLLFLCLLYLQLQQKLKLHHPLPFGVEFSQLRRIPTTTTTTPYIQFYSIYTCTRTSLHSFQSFITLGLLLLWDHRTTVCHKQVSLRWILRCGESYVGELSSHLDSTNTAAQAPTKLRTQLLTIVAKLPTTLLNPKWSSLF